MQLLSQENIDAVRVTSPGQIKPAAEALHRIAMHYGMRVAPAHDLADKRTPVDADGNMLATTVFGWTNDDRVWWRNSRIALDSPLTAACRFESQPFWANAEGFRTREDNPYLHSVDFSNFEQRAMTRAAIAIPVHLPFGQIGAVTFNPLDRDKTDLTQEFEELSDAFGLYARTFIVTYVQVMGATQALPPESRLSKREVECLRWAAIGKTDIEISMIMARSRATVRFHIHNAATKLNAVNRSQTVFKAAQLGYISLHN
ncbi:helix-turn-helix transcriptional regulator [Sphingobium subterraneum]|uniref:DNA-binding CsgD family transcriptional regulator n=1 Tax=Sphingobium subterraneum TaxID=627688 RepID=A0A841J3A3_9SPHN|nr:LuxR C-terminal-related transcriptional regulator [Sphingobium subterraneum]MBB6123996.1 DNA-binding CsgD family transcriptional regulator [Sphingobium subterraneum]